MQKFLLTLLVLLIQTVFANAQSPDYNSVARTIVTQAAAVQPGEVVLIRGAVESLEIFEALVAETLIAGGHPIPLLDLPEANNTSMREAPLEYLRQEHTAELALLEILDVYIEAVPGINPQLIARDIPTERRIAARDGRASYFEAVEAGSHREVYVGQSSGIPTPTYAEYIGADFGEMDGFFWRALSITPDEIQTVGDRITSVMTAGSTVHLTGANGTDITFTLSDEPTRISTGRASELVPERGPAQVFLPAGEFAACVDPASANGVVVAPVYTFRLREEVIGLSLTFKDGLITDMSAESGGESLQAFLETLDDSSRALSLVNIGLNPESRKFSGSNYLSWEMGGYITVFMGDNTPWQCGHTADFRLHPHIEGLTLTADGKPVVVQGVIQQE